jgi:hypothetical protein
MLTHFSASLKSDIRRGKSEISAGASLKSEVRSLPGTSGVAYQLHASNAADFSLPLQT